MCNSHSHYHQFSYYLSPWTNSVKLLESTVSPLLKVALHWMLVLLYSTDMFLKTSVPCLVVLLKTVITLVRLRSSSRVPFISHLTLVILANEDPQFKIGSLPGEKIWMSLEVSLTRNHKVSKEIHTITITMH